MKTFQDTINTVLDLIENNKDISEYVQSLKEVSVAEFMCRSAGLWITPHMQSPAMLFRGNIFTPKVISYHKRSGLMTLYADGSCYLITKEFDGQRLDTHFGWYPRFFLFKLCDHDEEQTNISNCYNRYTCKKCGYSYTIDSSD